MTFRVLIVDDHQVARLGMAELLRGSDFSIAAEVSSGAEAMEFLATGEKVDLVLLDIRMPKSDGLSVLQSLRQNYETLKVVVVSGYDNPTYIARAAALGADDYVLKSVSPQSIQNSLACVAAGSGLSGESRMRRTLRLMKQEVHVDDLPPELPVTSREAQVLRHIALGLGNKEIAISLDISGETVKEHVQNILRKIKAADRTDAAVRAVRLGLCD